MEDRILPSSNSDPPPVERGRRFVRAQPSVESEPDRVRDPLDDVELEPGWEPA